MEEPSYLRRCLERTTAASARLERALARVPNMDWAPDERKRFSTQPATPVAAKGAAFGGAPLIDMGMGAGLEPTKKQVAFAAAPLISLAATSPAPGPAGGCLSGCSASRRGSCSSGRRVSQRAQGG